MLKTINRLIKFVKCRREYCLKLLTFPANYCNYILPHSKQIIKG